MKKFFSEEDEVPMVTTTIEQLHALLDEYWPQANSEYDTHISELYGLLADAHLDEGNEGEAEAYRFLSLMGKHPLYSSDNDDWTWATWELWEDSYTLPAIFPIGRNEALVYPTRLEAEQFIANSLVQMRKSNEYLLVHRLMNAQQILLSGDWDVTIWRMKPWVTNENQMTARVGVIEGSEVSEIDLNVAFKEGTAEVADYWLG